MCSSLSFLDGYVANALSAGALPYQQMFSNIQETPEIKKGNFKGIFVVENVSNISATDSMYYNSIIGD